MTRRFLHCHLDTPCAEVQTLYCDVLALESGDLQLNYHLVGDLKALLIPEAMPSEQTDNLWEHSCFEAFVEVKGEATYHEYNFSPSSQWAAYAFSDYRERSTWDISHPPQLQCQQDDQTLTMKVTLEKSILPPNPQNKPFQIGLSAVLETKQGDKSYWALKHMAEKLDFHHRESFTLLLKPLRATL